MTTSSRISDSSKGQVAVVFDLDGVLMMSEHLWEAGWSSVAAVHGVDWTGRDTDSCQGRSVPEWGTYLAQLAGIDAEAATTAVIDSVIAAHERGEVTLIDGAYEMVAAAAARVPVALASSAPRLIIDHVMATTAVGPLFMATISSEEVARGKPHPDVYRAALARLGADPNRSFAVEDSSNGIRAAAAAGLGVFGLEHEQFPVAADARALTREISMRCQTYIPR